ncbi:MAG TPA: tetratricopeptide repeat protein [Kofleriaceae bacterium]|nr:tetratricopeptide repeat protein [Kofleriaceae bacterium]
MRRALSLLVGTLTLAPAGLAAAGSFGGFSRDGSRYLDGARVCQPVAGRQGIPSCEKKGADEVAALGFRKGALQRGGGAAISVQPSGTRLIVRSADGKTVRADWDSGNPVGSIAAVYLSDSGKLVAIEYDARVAGRAQPQVVVLRLAGGAGAAPGPGQPPGPASRPAPGQPGQGRAQPAPAGQAPTSTPATAAPDDPKLAAQIRAADRQLAARRWKKAEEEYRRALALAADHPAARYGLAAALAGEGRTTDAVAELAALRRSTHPQAPRWLVEARLGGHFTKMQGDPGFRRAVGIERDPARQPSAYERLVGLGGHWEQSGAACQDPTVTLDLDRKSEKFQLDIHTRCQGDDQTTKLSGTWRAEGAAALQLRFPNPGAAEEQLECQIGATADRSGEDALTCTLEDLTFTMRVVRR